MRNERDREKENTHKTDDNRREHRDYIRIECKAHWVDNLVGLLLWLSGIWISVCRVYFVHLSFGPSVLRSWQICQQRGRTQKIVDSAGGIKIQKTVLMVQPLREVFGLLGWVSSSAEMPRWCWTYLQLYTRWIEMITTTSIMNKENYILILVWFFIEWSSGVLLYTRSWSARREWWERTSFTLHTMGKKQKLVE